MVFKMIKKVVALTVIFALAFEQSGFAQIAAPLGIPNYINGYVAADRFRPLQLRSLAFDGSNDNFSLFLDKGDVRDLRDREIKANARKLSEYFRIGLALPNSSFWVNLRPDGEDQIIDPRVEKTDLGKVMLEADLQLKKDLAGFTSPNTPEGRKYWDNLYRKTEELFGQSEITVPTLTRPWIVPGEIIIRQSRDNAYIYKATLKVMLEQDYLKDAPGYNFDDPRMKTLNDYSSELIRQDILPKLTREVNSSKKYAGLRQVYYSLILAQWFKQSHCAEADTGASDSAGYKDTKSQVTGKINSNDLSGLTSKRNWSKVKYFQAYQRSFTSGEYNLQETVENSSGATIRQYFSGGESIVITPEMINVLGTPAASVQSSRLPAALESGLIEVQPNEVIIKHPARNTSKDAGRDGGSARVENGLTLKKIAPGIILTGTGVVLGLFSGAAFFGLLSIPLSYAVVTGIAGFSFLASGVFFIREGFRITGAAGVKLGFTQRLKVWFLSERVIWGNLRAADTADIHLSRAEIDELKKLLTKFDHNSAAEAKYMALAPAIVLAAAAIGLDMVDNVQALFSGIGAFIGIALAFHLSWTENSRVQNARDFANNLEYYQPVGRDGGRTAQSVSEMVAKNLLTIYGNAGWNDMLRRAKGEEWMTIHGICDARGEIELISDWSILVEYVGRMQFEVVDGKVFLKPSANQAIKDNYAAIKAVLEGTFNELDNRLASGPASLDGGKRPDSIFSAQADRESPVSVEVEKLAAAGGVDALIKELKTAMSSQVDDGLKCGILARKLGDLGDHRAKEVLRELISSGLVSDRAFAVNEAVLALRSLEEAEVTDKLNSLAESNGVFKVLLVRSSDSQFKGTPIERLMQAAQTPEEQDLVRDAAGYLRTGKFDNSLSKDGGRSVQEAAVALESKDLATRVGARQALADIGGIAAARALIKAARKAFNEPENPELAELVSALSTVVSGLKDAQVRQEAVSIFQEVYKEASLKRNWYLANTARLSASQMKPAESLRDGGKKEGGIDFRAMPTAIQPAVNPAAAIGGAALVSPRELDQQWSGIRQKMAKGEMPYRELKLYLSSCSNCKDNTGHIGTAAACIKNILKLEEERALPTAPELKEILAYLG